MSPLSKFKTPSPASEWGASRRRSEGGQQTAAQLSPCPNLPGQAVEVSVVLDRLPETDTMPGGIKTPEGRWTWTEKERSLLEGDSPSQTHGSGAVAWSKVACSPLFLESITLKSKAQMTRFLHGVKVFYFCLCHQEES